MRRHLLFVTLAIAIASLYLYQLDGFGVYGPDEPRYAAIGRAMAQSGDLVTPKLWGTPWFEKPPLLYWMTALGTAAGLSPDLCGRLPVALLSLGSLAIWFEMLRRDFDAPWYLWLNRPEPGTQYAKLPPLSESSDEMTINRWYGIYFDREPGCPTCGGFFTVVASAHGLDMASLGTVPSTPAGDKKPWS